ncbi:uncharacterized protein [Halyomorpha halys]|uniref:uncharacterized protein n=1 Tax=Halyomorpha halys TaxID=286706 RepID=UPI0006D4D66E|nr:uncharacterized protein LOC106683927 [Halyomorpha halys]
MSTTAMKDITVQTEFPMTADVSTNTVFPSFEQERYNLDILSSEVQRTTRTRSSLTLTDLPPPWSNTVLRERLRLLQEEAELEEQVQAARMAALRVKKELLLSRIKHFQDRQSGGASSLSVE